MSCANQICSSPIVITPPTSVWVDRPIVMKTVITFIDAFQEAWKMRFAIRKRYPFDGE